MRDDEVRNRVLNKIAGQMNVVPIGLRKNLIAVGDTFKQVSVEGGTIVKRNWHFTEDGRTKYIHDNNRNDMTDVGDTMVIIYVDHKSSEELVDIVSFIGLWRGSIIRAQWIISIDLDPKCGWRMVNDP